MKPKKHSIAAIIATIILSMAFIACGDDGDDDITVTYHTFETLNRTVTIENRTGKPVDAAVFDGMFDDTTGPNKTKLENALDGLTIVVLNGVADAYWVVDVASKTISRHYDYVSNGIPALGSKLRTEIITNNTFAALKFPNPLLFAANTIQTRGSL